MKVRWNQPFRHTSHQVRPPATVRRRSKLLCFYFMMIVNYWYNETEFNLSTNFLLENDPEHNQEYLHTNNHTTRTFIILYPHEDSILGHLQNAFECHENKNKLLFVLSDGIIMWGVADVDENQIDQWLLASDHPVTIFYNTTLIYTESQVVVCLCAILHLSAIKQKPLQLHGSRLSLFCTIFLSCNRHPRLCSVNSSADWELSGRSPEHHTQSTECGTSENNLHAESARVHAAVLIVSVKNVNWSIGKLALLPRCGLSKQ